MNIEKAAEEIASEADECCYRGGEWEEGIKVLALQKLKEAYNLGIEDAADEIEYCNPKEAEEIRKLRK